MANLSLSVVMTLLSQVNILVFQVQDLAQSKTASIQQSKDLGQDDMTMG
ncbi:MAG: hypothetical protein IPM37_24020 [Hahellaceae bacterium]|nr:hypothetical protein [Hahellaceae bacterium]